MPGDECTDGPISIHALREEGDVYPSFGVNVALYISIHALREEGDRIAQRRGGSERISIHALREEGDDLGTIWA